MNYAALVAELESALEIDKTTELCIWSIDGEKHAAMLHMTITITDQALAKSAARTILEKHDVAYLAIEVDEKTYKNIKHTKKTSLKISKKAEQFKDCSAFFICHIGYLLTDFI